MSVFERGYSPKFSPSTFSAIRYVDMIMFLNCYSHILFYSVNSKPTKNEILDHVVPHVTPRWYVLGLKLLKKDQETQLDIIKLNHAGDNQMCCMEMFWYWLSTNTDASWQQLVEALRSPVVKLPVVAADIEKMFTGNYIVSIDNRS